MSAPPYRRFVCATAASVLALGLVVLGGGWAADVAALRSPVPGTVGMKAWTAIGLACLGAALLLAVLRPRRHPVALRALCGVAAALGAATLVQYVTGVDLGFDELLFADAEGRENGIKYPGRMAPTAAVNFVLAAVAVLTLDRPAVRGWQLGELLAVPVALIDWMSLIGYAYEIPAFYGPAGAAKMAVHTAVAFELLAFGILLARPRGRLLALARTEDASGVILRRLVPLAVLVPLVLGWLRLRTIDWGLVDDNVGTWWLSAATIAVEVGMIVLCASSLARVEAARRRADAELAAVHAELERSNRDLERFAAVVSHDVRAPLRTISGFVAMLDRRPDDPAAAEWRALILRTAHQTDHLICGLRELARVQRGPRTVQPVALDALLDDVQAALAAGLAERGARIERRPLPVVSGDPDQLRALLQNLIANASKFSDRATPAIEVRAERADPGWEVVVADDGIGVDPRFAEEIFEMGRRLHASDEYEGTGTGLAICKAIVDRHGGSIAAASRPGGGTEMRVTLPR